MEATNRRNWVVRIFNSFEEADASERAERLAMTGEERLRITEHLRAQYYGYAESGVEPRLERTIKTVPFS
jgi:hypothetical protein